jgi:hypothetical protein
MKSNKFTWNFNQIAKMVESGTLDTNCIFQRELCWKPIDRDWFFSAMLMGIDCGKIILNKITDKCTNEILDGLQRSCTIKQITNSEFRFGENCTPGINCGLMQSDFARLLIDDGCPILNKAGQVVNLSESELNSVFTNKSDDAEQFRISLQNKSFRDLPEEIQKFWLSIRMPVTQYVDLSTLQKQTIFLNTNHGRKLNTFTLIRSSAMPSMIEFVKRQVEASSIIFKSSANGTKCLLSFIARLHGARSIKVSDVRKTITACSLSQEEMQNIAEALEYLSKLAATDKGVAKLKKSVPLTVSILGLTVSEMKSHLSVEYESWLQWLLNTPLAEDLAKTLGRSSTNAVNCSERDRILAVSLKGYKQANSTVNPLFRGMDSLTFEEESQESPISTLVPITTTATTTLTCSK